LALRIRYTSSPGWSPANVKVAVSPMYSASGTVRVSVPNGGAACSVMSSAGMSSVNTGSEPSSRTLGSPQASTKADNNTMRMADSCLRRSGGAYRTHALDM
jgi:hypothetical protein